MVLNRWYVYHSLSWVVNMTLFYHVLPTSSRQMWYYLLKTTLEEPHHWLQTLVLRDVLLIFFCHGEDCPDFLNGRGVVPMLIAMHHGLLFRWLRIESHSDVSGWLESVKPSVFFSPWLLLFRKILCNHSTAGLSSGPGAIQLLDRWKRYAGVTTMLLVAGLVE